MSRMLYLTSALLAGAAVAGFHATAPDCTGWYCLAMGAKPAALEESRPSTLPTAGRQIGGERTGPTGSEEAVLASPHLEQEAEPFDQAALAARELETDRRRRADPARRAAAFEGIAPLEAADWEDDEADDPARRRTAEKAARKAADAWEVLVTAALEAPDPETRGRAIGDVGLRRDHDAVAVLLEVAAFEPDPDNRFRAVKSLWYSAADGLDADGGIRSALQAARTDPDERIAELAEAAMSDLEALEAAN